MEIGPTTQVDPPSVLYFIEPANSLTVTFVPVIVAKRTAYTKKTVVTAITVIIVTAKNALLDFRSTLISLVHLQ